MDAKKVDGKEGNREEGLGAGVLNLNKRTSTSKNIVNHIKSDFMLLSCHIRVSE